MEPWRVHRGTATSCSNLAILNSKRETKTRVRLCQIRGLDRALKSRQNRNGMLRVIQCHHKLNEHRVHQEREMILHRAIL